MYLKEATRTGVSETLSQIYFVYKFHEINIFCFAYNYVIILQSTPDFIHQSYPAIKKI